jgi:hypothetical protein
MHTVEPSGSGTTEVAALYQQYKEILEKDYGIGEGIVVWDKN